MLLSGWIDYVFSVPTFPAGPGNGASNVSSSRGGNAATGYGSSGDSFSGSAVSPRF